MCVYIGVPRKVTVINLWQNRAARKDNYSRGCIVGVITSSRESHTYYAPAREFFFASIQAHKYKQAAFHGASLILRGAFVIG